MDTRDNASPRTLKVCFVGLHAYSLFNAKTRYHFGGAEVRSYLLSRGLAEKPGISVSYVVYDHGQARIENHAGVSVRAHSGYASDAGPKFIRQFRAHLLAGGASVRRTHRFTFRRMNLKNARLEFEYLIVRIFERATALLRRLRRPPGSSLRVGDYKVPWERYAVYDAIDADVYCVLGVTNLSGELAAYCLSRKKKFALFIADVTNLDERYLSDPTGENSYGDLHVLCNHAIMQADLIVTQVESQRTLLWQRFCRPAITVKNPIDLRQFARSIPEYSQRKIAIWVGRADRFKKMPLLLLDLARRCPDVEFCMVLNPHYLDVEQQVKHEKPSNVCLQANVPYDTIEDLYAKSFVLISTSLTEGFPNTFLQAGKYGVPILSYVVDPDGFIELNDCGIVAHGNMTALVNGLRTIQIDQAGPCRYSRNILEYVHRNHNLTEKIDQVATALRGLTNNPINNRLCNFPNH